MRQMLQRDLRAASQGWRWLRRHGCSFTALVLGRRLRVRKGMHVKAEGRNAIQSSSVFLAADHLGATPMFSLTGHEANVRLKDPCPAGPPLIVLDLHVQGKVRGDGKRALGAEQLGRAAQGKSSGRLPVPRTPSGNPPPRRSRWSNTSSGENLRRKALIEISGRRPCVLELC